MTETGVAAVPCASEPGRSQRSIVRTLAKDLLGALVVAVVLTVVMGPTVLDDRSKWFRLLQINVIMSISIGTVIANSFRFALPALLRRFPGPIGRVASHIVLVLVATPLGVELAVRLAEALIGTPATHLRATGLRVGFAVVATVLAIVLSYERLRERARRDELRAQEAEREALRARLTALQARTNPHFLFNSLNTVASLIDDDPAAAERALEALSDLFRYTLKGSQSEWVRLGEEMEAVASYLGVEELRLGERLDYAIDVEAGLESAWIPPLLLQPLVENAVLHGVAPRREGGRIVVSARADGDRLRLGVRDDGVGPGRSGHSGSGTSLDDLSQRLELVYGGAARFETGPSESGIGYRARLTLPRRGVG